MILRSPAALWRINSNLGGIDLQLPTAKTKALNEQIIGDSSLFFGVNPDVLSSWEDSMIQKTLLYTSTFESQPFCTMSCGLAGVLCLLSCEDRLSASFKAAAHWARVLGGSIMIVFLPTIYRGFTKGRFSIKKGWLWGMFPRTKTGTRAHPPKPHTFTKPPFCLLSKPTGVLRPPGPKISKHFKAKGLLMPSGLRVSQKVLQGSRSESLQKFTFKSVFFSDISALSDFLTLWAGRPRKTLFSLLFETLSGFSRPGGTGDS